MLVYCASPLSVVEKGVVIRSDDTDVFILLLHHQIHMSGKIYMDMGLDSKNNRRFNNMTETASRLGPEVILIKLKRYH